MSGDELRKMSAEDVKNLTDFIRNNVERIGCKGVVIGLSGGLDSAVVTKLCVDAIGADKVLNVFMPTTVTSSEEYRDTMELSKLWGTEYKVVDIQPAVDAFTAALFSKVKAPLERGNISARCRMIVLFNNAKKRDSIVVGTSNKSEVMMGYFTKFGDGACDLVPTIGLYKTQIREIAKLIDVPQKIIDKTPTAGLWEGQTDEDEMGITYHDLDIVLSGIERGLDDLEISDIVGLPSSKIADVRDQVAKMDHKRHPAIQPDLAFD